MQNYNSVCYFICVRYVVSNAMEVSEDAGEQSLGSLDWGSNRDTENNIMSVLILTLRRTLLGW
jgi:hypothetical protein